MAVEDWPALVESDDLTGLPGGPFTPKQIDVASGKVRGAAGWHIAPLVTETVVLDHDGGSVVHLRSLRVVDVASVRDVSGATPRDITDWRWSESGMISGSFPCGFRSVEVTFTHGYEECPDELLSVVAGATREGPIRSQGAGPFQVTYGSDEGSTNPHAVLDRYRIGLRP